MIMISSIGSTNDMMGLMDLVNMNASRRNLFDKADQDGNGFLDKLELQSVAEHASETIGKTIPVDRVINDLDTNKDGRISKEEFSTGKEKIKNLIGFSGDKPKIGGMKNEDFSKMIMDMISQRDEENEKEKDEENPFWDAKFDPYRNYLDTLYNGGKHFEFLA